MKRLFVFRPEPGLRVTLETARSLSLEISGCPLFEVEPVSWSAPPAEEYDALLVGSSNVFRHGGTSLPKLETLPVYAVGEATAEGAREKGFLVTKTGKGGLQVLLDELAGRELRMLRLCGEARVVLDPPAGITIDTQVVYRTTPLEVSVECAAAMHEEGGVALLHSGEAARRLRAECERLGIDRGKLIIAALGPRIADMAGEGWQSVHTAAQPLDAELLALAQALCQG